MIGIPRKDVLQIGTLGRRRHNLTEGHLHDYAEENIGISESPED